MGHSHMTASIGHGYEQKKQRLALISSQSLYDSDYTSFTMILLS